MPNSFNSISVLEVTAMGTSLKLRIEMGAELKEKLEKHYKTDCALKLIVGEVLGLVDFEQPDDVDDVDGNCYELTLPQEA